MSRNRKQKHSLTYQVQESLKIKLAIGHSKQEDKKHCSEEEIALAEFLEKRQEINQLFLVAKAEMQKISRK